MKWKPFIHENKEYNLDHLHPFEWEFTAPATSKAPERTYHLNVAFSMHTFTRGIQPDESLPDLEYQDNREKRAFDFLRYELSKKLPDIVTQLGERNCYHTNHGSFFTIELVDEDNQSGDYEIFFKVSRSSTNGWLNLYIVSAYMRDPDYQSSQPKKRKIGFKVIANNVTRGKRINPGK